MLSTDVVLDYYCPHCQEPIHAKLNCAGPGLREGPNVAARVNLSCPTCDKDSELIFKMDGGIVDIHADERLMLLEPSLN